MKTIVVEDLPGTHLVLESSCQIALSMTQSLTIPLEDEAIGAFFSRYGQSRDEGLNSMWDQIFALSGQAQRDKAEVDVVFDLAVRASSLAFFAKTRCESVIMRKANDWYTQALRKLKSIILDTTCSTSDQVLLAVLLLSNYENMSARSEDPRLYCESFQHMDGAMALLNLRRQNLRGILADKSLDREVRSQIIRQAVYRGIPIPVWLQSGKQFGLEGSELLLDSCIVKTAILRHNVSQYLKLLTQSSCAVSQTVLKQLSKLLCDARSLDEQLTEWSSNVPPEYIYEAYMFPTSEPQYRAAYYCGMTSTYTSIAHAAMWNRYRGARLVVSCLVNKIIGYITIVNGGPREDMQAQLEQTRSTQQGLVDEICASVPFLLGNGNSAASTYGAFTLSWPLIITLAVQTLSDDQRQWIRDQLRLISTITASGIFERVSKLDLHSHRGPILMNSLGTAD